ncbi:hypothetical protein R1flu_017227 [Riccia fluitans]|uniref:GH16 domain-containing protein n=1 Tax=Riccia fluitans TaxID=41844 RepID=A0ABD1XE87_9MARC
MASHDEIDIEFLGNVTGQPSILHTNLFANGVGNREQQVYLWFDPSQDSHNYTVIWNHKQVTWFVDGTPIRIYKNIENVLLNSYPKSQPMVVAHCIYDGSSWATSKGDVPVNWQYAPFVVNFGNFDYEGCTTVNSPCTTNYQSNWWEAAEYQDLSKAQQTELKQIYQKYQLNRSADTSVVTVLVQKLCFDSDNGSQRSEIEWPWLRSSRNEPRELDLLTSPALAEKLWEAGLNSVSSDIDVLGRRAVRFCIQDCLTNAAKLSESKEAEERKAKGNLASLPIISSFEVYPRLLSDHYVICWIVKEILRREDSCSNSQTG